MFIFFLKATKALVNTDPSFTHNAATTKQLLERPPWA